MNNLLIGLNKIPNVKAVVYADDLAVLLTDKFEEQMEKLFTSVKTLLDDLCTKQQMSINPLKSVVLIFPASQKKRTHSFDLNGHSLKLSPAVKYLSIWLNSKLKWNRRIKKIIAGALRLRGKIFLLFGRFCQITTLTRRRI